MEVVHEPIPVPKAERSLGRLMVSYERNYRLFDRLFEDDPMFPSHLASRGRDGMCVYLDVLERHRYTTFLRLTYLFPDRNDHVLDPSAVIRLYHDARVAEVTSLYASAEVQRLCGFPRQYGSRLGERWRSNRFLEKWLVYLLRQGHRMDGWHSRGPNSALDEDITDQLQSERLRLE